MPNPLDSPSTIEIAVPARPAYGATLRLVASAIGADAGWSVDEIDDVRLAITEALSIVGGQAGIMRLCAGFSVHDGEVTMHLRVDPPISLRPPAGLSATILGAVMDHVDWRSDGATLTKRSAERSR